MTEGLWGYINQLTAQVPEGEKLNIMDNATGAGALFHFARPEKHALFGNDVDARCIDALVEDCGEAGFDFQLEHAGMESINASNMDVAVINPPFGLTLKHPDMTPYDCCTHGTFGPATHALSHQAY